MSGGAVLAIDQGTTGSSALVISARGEVVARAYSEFAQHFPRPGWVEHDAEEIFAVTARVAREAVAAANTEVAAVGITNQRETVVVWDPATLQPLHRAIVWQDRRTSEMCRELRAAGHEEMVRRRTGLLLDPYFSGTKLRWLFETDPELAARAESGDLAAGTIDSWLVARLTAGAVHATDPTNASRTLLFDLDEGGWNDDLLDLTGVPRRILPQVRPSSGDFGVTDGGHSRRGSPHRGRGRRPAGGALRPGVLGGGDGQVQPTEPARSCSSTRAPSASRRVTGCSRRRPATPWEARPSPWKARSSSQAPRSSGCATASGF